MKSTKKNIIVLAVIIVIVLIIYALFSHKSLDAKLMTVDSTGVKIYDFSNGKVSSMDVEKYCKDNGKNIICTENTNDSYDVILITPDGKETLYKSDTFITSNIIEHNDVLYFTADENNSHILRKTYLYSLQNNVLETIYENEVAGELLQYDNTVIFTDMNNEEIMAYYPETRKFEKICDGAFPCWKEYGKSIFISTGIKSGGKLGIVDIDSKEITLLDTDVKKPVAYNSKHNTLLYMGIDDITSYGTPDGISRLVNLDTLETTYTYKYQNLIQRLLNNDFFNIYRKSEWIN